MEQHPLIDEFFMDDGADLPKRKKLFEATKSGPLIQYFTFNVSNVRIDHETKTATIEDELDAVREVSMPLSEFVTLPRERM